MTSARKQRKQLARWERRIRQWATETGKALTLDLCQDNDPAIAPYNVGVVLDPGEKAWVQVPARCWLDTPPVPAGASRPPPPPFTEWLVTNTRIVGRYSNGELHGWRWEWIDGLLTDLTPGQEYVHLDSREQDGVIRIDWTGPGVVPLAVAAVYHLYGARALLDHPGLAPIRMAAPSSDFQWEGRAVTAGTLGRSARPAA